MAEGISVKLPLIYDKKDGPFQLNKDIQDTVKQNFKNLVLTNKGERIMDPDFGIGISSFLFQNYTPQSSQEIKYIATTQTQKYMPFLDIIDFIVSDSSTDLNQFNIYIKYFIRSLNVLDELTFVVSK